MTDWRTFHLKNTELYAPLTIMTNISTYLSGCENDDSCSYHLRRVLVADAPLFPAIQSSSGSTTPEIHSADLHCVLFDGNE